MEQFDGKVYTRKIQTGDKEELLAFNKRMYPSRDNHEESLNYRIYNNPLIKEHESLLCHLTDKKIIGQIFLLPSEIGDQKESHFAVFGSDYIVDEQYRGSIAGTNLCKKSTKINYHFGINLSEISLKMHTIFKEKIVGYITKYMFIINPLKGLQFFTGANLNKQENYPDKLNLKEGSLTKAKLPNDIQNETGYWSSEYYAFKRDTAFLDWRYFNSEKTYQVYTLDNGQSNKAYIVVRQILWKKFKSLMVTDYRFNNEDEFRLLLKAGKRLAKQNGCFNLIVTSSMSKTESVLKAMNCIKFGEVMNVVSNFPVEEEKEFLVTYADSDIDLQY